MFICPVCHNDSEWTAVRVEGVCPACRRSLRDRDGILAAGALRHAEDYPEEAYASVFQAEQEHFWFRSRNRLIARTLTSALPGRASPQVLDMGCGTGGTLAFLDGRGLDVCGMDMHRGALLWTRRRTAAPLVCGDLADVPFRDEFDAVLLCDVLEHAGDDLAALRYSLRAARPGGIVLITVPACPRLWSETDAQSGHKRRYTRAGLAALIAAAGAVPKWVRYFNTALVGAILLRRCLRDRLRGWNARGNLIAEELRTPPAPLNALLYGLSACENRIGAGVPLPFGASLIAVGRRAPGSG